MKVSLQKNLGENGTGIRRNISSTEKPFHSTELPIVKLNTNNTAKSNATNDDDVYLHYPGNETFTQHNKSVVEVKT